MRFASIIGTGSYLPDKVVSNCELEATLDTSDAWIRQRTGICRRHIAAEHETVKFMGCQAARRALKVAGVAANQLDLIIVATCTGEQVFPATACALQAELGVGIHCPAFDVQAACSGFLYALGIANYWIKGGGATNVLIVGAEAMSRVVDWQDRSTCVLFGDGAGAVVLTASKLPGILSTHLGANGNFGDALYLNNEHFIKNSYLQMQGNLVFRQAVQGLSEAASLALSSNNLQTEDLDWLVPHQANLRIIKATAKHLGLPMEKVIATVDEHANTSGASIPIALDVGISSGKIKPGDLLLLEAFGGGLTWGSALIRYGVNNNG